MFSLQAYNTDNNNVLPDVVGKKLQDVKPKLESLLDAKTHNFILLKKGPTTVAQFVLNRKKDKWTKKV